MVEKAKFEKFQNTVQRFEYHALHLLEVHIGVLVLNIVIRKYEIRRNV